MVGDTASEHPLPPQCTNSVTWAALLISSFLCLGQMTIILRPSQFWGEGLILSDAAPSWYFKS